MLDESVGNGLCAVPYEMDEPYTAQFAAEQMSTGHLHEMVRVPPDTSKTGHPEWDDPFLVRQKGLEPPTLGTGIRCSIH